MFLLQGYMYSDDHYNYNYGQAKAAVEQYKDAEEVGFYLTLIRFLWEYFVSILLAFIDCFNHH